MARVFLGLGSNLADREKNMFHAMKFIANLPKTKLVRCSSIYETEPWGISEQPRFLNCACEIETQLKPEELLHLIIDIEKSIGRERTKEKFGPRTIDVDILFYDDLIVSQADLKIPHPRMHLRKFVLVPLCEIAPDFLHPAIQKKIRELLDECPDELNVELFSAPPEINSNEG